MRNNQLHGAGLVVFHESLRQFMMLAQVAAFILHRDGVVQHDEFHLHAELALKFQQQRIARDLRQFDMEVAIQLAA